MIPVQFLSERRLVSFQANTPVHQAARAICQSEGGCALVTGEKGQLIGLVTERDLACSVVGKSKNSDVPLHQVMTCRPLAVEKTADLETVVYLMVQSGIRRVPVVERRGSGDELYCIALITLDDLIVSKLVNYDQLARIVNSQNKNFRAPLVPIKHPHHGSLNEFYRKVQLRTGLNGSRLLDVTDEVLSAITQRLQYTSAAHFIAYLPEALQERLLELPPGPNPQITLATLTERLKMKYRLSAKQTSSLIQLFFAALGALLPQSEISFLRSELPEEFSRFLPLDQAQEKNRAA